MPGVLILEALAQIGGILAYASDPFDPAQSLMYFLSIDKAKFRNTVTPGDRLDLHVQVLHHRSNVWKLKGEATVDGALCAEGELLASIVDRAV
jgi:3-hydroxyacyl-[acyl-carrier-protein] dehydratase